MMKKENYLKPAVEVVEMMDELCDSINMPVVSGDIYDSGDIAAPKRKDFDDDVSFSIGNVFGREQESAVSAEASSWD